MGSKCEKHYCDKKIPSITFPSWMSFLNNDLELKDLTIPGTHESCALHGIFFAVNQTWSLENQLNAGIRFFDLRMRLYYNTLRAYHGIVNQKMNFSEIIYIFSKFLKKYPSEFILMSIQKENTDKKSNRTIEQVYNDYIKNYKDIIINYEPNLYNEKVEKFRGKIIFFNAFEHRLDIQSGFFAQNNWVVNFSADIKTKNKYIKTQFNRAITYNQDDNLYINYISGSSDYLMVSPALIAYYTNKEVLKYEGRMGIVLCDYPGEGLIYHLISQNFSKDFNFENIAKYNPLKIKSDSIANLILNNIKYKITPVEDEKELISFESNISFIHVNTYKYFALDKNNELICQKEKFTWFIDIVEKGVGNGRKDKLEKNDKVSLKNGNVILTFVLNKIKNRHNFNKNRIRRAVYNCDIVAIQENEYYLNSSYFQKNKNDIQNITKIKGIKPGTEFIITNN
jgi:1-phosphatidylinositol phosphodiesterase